MTQTNLDELCWKAHMQECDSLTVNGQVERSFEAHNAEKFAVELALTELYKRIVQRGVDGDIAVSEAKAAAYEVENFFTYLRSKA